MPPRPPARLHLLPATAAPVACVIRRGPSRWFHVALWRYHEGIVEHGAWTKLKLYPERCGLSPDGRHLAVFALGGTWGPYFAVSKAPWLQALAAWETVGTWTTGADIADDGTLILSGCANDQPFQGSYPGTVACVPLDMHWVRARLFRELRTGWRIAALRQRGSDQHEAEPWVAHLPAPVGAVPDSVVAIHNQPNGGDRHLVLVSLEDGHREYYLLQDGHVASLDSVVRAHWGMNGELIAASSSGRLQILDDSLRTTWEYDMNVVEPSPMPAPDWAKIW